MERNLLSDLYNWKLSSTRKPLILEGARQVGKTYLLRAFAQQAYAKEAYVYLHRIIMFYVLFVAYVL